jgi:hypothetical protein
MEYFWIFITNPLSIAFCPDLASLVIFSFRALFNIDRSFPKYISSDGLNASIITPPPIDRRGVWDSSDGKNHRFRANNWGGAEATGKILL